MPAFVLTSSLVLEGDTARLQQLATAAEAIVRERCPDADVILAALGLQVAAEPEPAGTDIRARLRL